MLPGLENINLSLFSILFGMYLIVTGFIYYIIFHNHHKKNKIELWELINLVSKFYSIFILSTISVSFGIFCIIDAHSYNDERIEVISRVSLGIIIISITIINFIFYIKRNLKDLDLNIREENKKQTMKIGEILELIIFTIFLFMPIWRIPNFIELYQNNKGVIVEILKSIFISLLSLLLLYNLNPMDIKEKIGKK